MKISATFTVHIDPVTPPPPPPDLTLTPNGGPLQAEVVGNDSKQTVAVIAGGKPPYKLSVTAGAVPDGQQLFLEDDGVTVTLEGSPTTPGDASFELTVTDSQ